MCQLILKLSSVLKLLKLSAKLLVNIKTQDFYSCLITVSYREIKQKVITQANDYRRVKAYTP